MTVSEALKAETNGQVLAERLPDLDDDSHRRRRLIGFLGGVALCLVVTLLLVEFYCRFFVFVSKPTLNANPQYDAKYLVAQTVAPWDDNIVLCGDSLVKQGLYPELIAAKLQKFNDHIRVVNLAVNAGSQEDAISYLEYLKKMRCTKPRLLIYDFEVNATGGGSTTRKKALVKQQADYFQDAVLRRPTTLIESLSVAPSDVSLLVRHRGRIKHFIFDFLTVFPNLNLYSQRSSIELCNVDDFGTTYCGMSPDHYLITAKDVEPRNSSINPDWYGSPKHGNFQYNPDAYSVLIKYCQKEEIPLMLVWLPHQQAIYEKFWYQEPYTNQWFRAKFADYARQLFVFPVYLNNLGPDWTYYSDFRHLSTYGCVKASELLAEALGQQKYRTLIEHRPSKWDGTLDPARPSGTR